MTTLVRIVAAHPLSVKEPYKRIKFSRVLPNGTPLYKVGKGKREYGAETALRKAYERFGGNCFHCNQPIPSDIANAFTLDHLRPKRDGGDDYLHNLVFACRSCNQRKAGNDLVTFHAEIAASYLRALDDHLVRCLKGLKLG